MTSTFDYLVIDFETKDNMIDKGLGGGWAYDRGLKILGCAFLYPNSKTEYIVSKDAILKRIEKTSTLIVYNANYDIGILYKLGIDIKKYLIIDVLLMSRLFDSSRLSHSLNSCSKDYIGEVKSDQPLGDLALELGLTNNKDHCIKAAKSNMDKIQQANKTLVAEYAIQDVVLTYKLKQYYEEKEGIDYYRYEFYSDLIKVAILNRVRGVRVDLIKLLKIESELQLKILELQLKLNEFNNGKPVNSKSPIDLPELLIKHGINLKKSDKDNYICDKNTLEEIQHPISDVVLELRKVLTLKNNFITKIIEAQKHTMGIERSEFGSKYLVGKIYPEIGILGGAATGRCSSSNPNIQNIPSRDKEYAKLIRGFILPDEGYEYIASCDYSAQEPRLLIHDACFLNSKEVKPIQRQFIDNPKTDFHKIASENMNVDRTTAKTIGLGLLYGMGVNKLAKSLGVDIKQASFLRELYFEKLPFVRDLITKIKHTLKEKGYIKTIKGNKLRLDKSVIDDNGQERTFEYKALNKRIQGSAANQTNEAMVRLYRKGISFMFPVHDEVVASVNSLKEAQIIGKEMEQAVKLAIPSVVDVNIGVNWGECK